MENFSYYNPVELIYGPGQANTVAEQVARYGSRVLFVYGQNHLKESGDYDRIAEKLDHAGLTRFDLPGVEPNPRQSLVKKGIEICKEEDIDFILGVGGGSVSDSAKAIAMGAKVDYDVWEMFEDFHNIMHGASPEDHPHIPTEIIPLGVVMTKAGTGSDFDYTSVLSNKAADPHEKLMVINKVMYPAFTIQDPELTTTLPERQIAYGSADIMTHIFEQYFTPTTDIDILDRYKEGALKTVIECGQRALADPADTGAQGSLLYIAGWACSDQYMTGTLGGWAAHMIEHELSAATDLNHGHGMAITYLAWMEYVLDALPWKFAQYGERVWGLKRGGRSDMAVGKEAIDRTREFWSEKLGITLKLSEAGVPESVLPTAAAQAVRFGDLNSLKLIGEQEALEILKMAY